MLIIPAIDLLGGKAVRLRQGDMDDYTVYYDNPLDAAKKFADMGVKRLHIVDLDGARDGETTNFDLIEQIVSKAGMDVEVGGGLRKLVRVEGYFNIGVKYCILGTAVVKDPDFVMAAMKKYPHQIILGIDAKDGCVATEGWYEKSELTAAEVIKSYEGYCAESVIYTDIMRDGMLSGINIEATLSLAEEIQYPVIASGGLKGIEDIEALSGKKNILGAITGKAFYEGRIDLEEALRLQG
ncbi:phosphoribosylformimino-5-aminoimidazole carboxamide ribotide isomerase [Denitrovibrio acetiphilus DSM 12809]|uniref:1-(5-phosphoribosyl)-5-[(5-phosphoribosylamino)methylideneamino] imidazole-4-carboxamide isomerase n=1 Tax=Denitrovibrio acetiphilus (strain DSM 12809 / NBRC 114555 / N2460) TaxID=522772 RepID=D4H5V5_DENA2|nr:1-(5-phosphoribosyl)-5-[(5-phosphoribosylamino)methylideneamino]imidazole-4-carboxamide isomerase [Denitrovibrio acetiphilus]ADD69546.1 phosphoribosylformimino-5-aminoimidazole carboxamide ribotide isomerase [Denitrovibrio acetiphilus DSM 12809]